VVGTKPSTWRERRKFEPLRIGAVVHLGNEESEVEVALCNGDLRFLVQALSKPQYASLATLRTIWNMVMPCELLSPPHCWQVLRRMAKPCGEARSLSSSPQTLRPTPSRRSGELAPPVVISMN
jgi:hypothetical protein